MPLFMVTANATLSGHPLFLRPDGSWSERFLDGATTTDEAERDRWLVAARSSEREACDAYVFEVVEHEGQLVPVEMKDQSRVRGPTIRYGEWR